MIEEIIIKRLNAVLGIYVGGEVPVEPDQRFVVVRKRGGERTDHIYTSLIQFDVYAERLSEASALCKALVEAVDDLTCLDEICNCEYGGDYNATDTASKRYRYQAMYNITHY